MDTHNTHVGDYSMACRDHPQSGVRGVWSSWYVREWAQIGSRVRHRPRSSPTSGRIVVHINNKVAIPKDVPPHPELEDDEKVW